LIKGIVVGVNELKTSNPLLCVDVIVRFQRKIVLIRRKNPPQGWALPGGVVDDGETVETAARREIDEEIGLELRDLSQWKVFSDPDRDPRGHAVSVCFTAAGRGTLEANSDADAVELFSLHSSFPDLAFDHDRILTDFQRQIFTPYRRLSEDG
jgi:ADP-ribose pyrophosphatase YjhB (NUDIX family)